MATFSKNKLPKVGGGGISPTPLTLLSCHNALNLTDQRQIQDFLMGVRPVARAGFGGVLFDKMWNFPRDFFGEKVGFLRAFWEKVDFCAFWG